MKKIIFSASVLILLATASSAQQSVVSSGGGVNKFSNGVVLEWTLGEPVIGVSTTATRLYTAGFHQPYITVKEVVTEIRQPAKTVQVFPNPVSNRLLVQLPSGQQEQVKLILTDLAGHILIEKQLSGKSGLGELSMESLTGGVYQLRVIRMDGSVINVFKVVKL